MQHGWISGGPCHYSPFYVKLAILALWVIFIWVVLILISHYGRYYYTKKEIKEFLKTLKFLDSQKGVNPYNQGKFAKIPGCRIVQIIFSGLWEIYNTKIKNKELKIENMKGQVEKILLVKNYKLLFMCALSFFLGLLLFLLKCIRTIHAYFLLTDSSKMDFKDFFVFSITDIANCEIQIFNFSSN